MNEIKADLEIQNVTKYFPGEAGSKLLVLDNINLTNDFKQNKGSIVSILAPFASGKSTLLKIIAAIETPSEGKIILNGRQYDKPDGQIVYIPEKPSSYPWLNVKQNIIFASAAAKNNKSDIHKLISAVGLTGYEEHYPHEKSTGFRFRIALARALAVNPVLVLLDDPFKKLTGETKKEIYSLVKKICSDLKINFLLSTTNVTESIILSDKVYLMKSRPGKIFKEIEIEQDKISNKNTEFYTVVRSEIESAYSEFEGTPLISEIQFK